MKIFEKAKEKVAVVIPVAAGAALVPVQAFASESGTANTAVVTAMTGVANDMTATATSIIPVALGVVGLSLVVVFGIKIFKRISGR